MQKIHYHNDFSVTLTLENMRVELIEQVIFYTRSRGNQYSCAYCCGTLTKQNLDTVICVLDGHNLEAGVLKYTVIFQIPDTAYPDGFQRVCQHHTTDIELVTGNGDTTIGTAIAVYNGNAECVYEFSKFVMGASFLEDAIEVEIGQMVFCNANKDLSGDYYHKFLVNTDGTVEGLEIMQPYANKIYINATNGNCYRWSGSNLVEFSKSMVLGETNTTAYAGSKGKANAAAIAEIQEQIRNYTADDESQLPTDVPEFALAKVSFGGLKTYSELQEGDYIYKVAVNTDVTPTFPSSRTVTITLPNNFKIHISPHQIIQVTTPNNRVANIYISGAWDDNGIALLQADDVSGIANVINADIPIDWLLVSTKPEALLIYLSGTWQEIALK